MEKAVDLDLKLNGGEETMDTAADYKLIAEDLMKMEECEKGIDYIEKALEFEKTFYGGIADR